VADTVRLIGGPFGGTDVPIPGGRSLIIELPDEPGRVARYRPTRNKGVWRFREYDTIVGTIPASGSVHA
jgi:hypothetical protein